MSIPDLLDESVAWLPNTVYWQNYVDAYQKMNFPFTFKNTFMNSVIPMFGQLLSCAIAGYGLGRYRFRGSGLIFVLLLICLIVPPQTTIIAFYSMYANMELINTYWPTILPALFAQGIRGALFTLIFTQFFKGLPRELDEAARIDGAGAFRVFSRVMLPLAKPAIFVVAVFSLVWHWNDNFYPRYFANKAEMFTMPWQLEIINYDYLLKGSVDANLNEGMLMAAVILIVAPLFLVYMVGQRYLVEGIERTGLAGD
ncbi:carbohydrate ABC transporter permease [Paenibacillus sp.]|uniref:carbohydrate ABC transporter permease n=1 Tax=Paenibacillus sp. TaxID=58172 RepID=UPI0028122B6F|nr:carbohydrate ABC transporter permease [Paenibacillus sp.]